MPGGPCSWSTGSTSPRVLLSLRLDTRDGSFCALLVREARPPSMLPRRFAAFHPCYSIISHAPCDGLSCGRRMASRRCTIALRVYYRSLEGHRPMTDNSHARATSSARSALVIDVALTPDQLDSPEKRTRTTCIVVDVIRAT